MKPRGSHYIVLSLTAVSYTLPGRVLPRLKSPPQVLTSNDGETENPTALRPT